MTEILDVRTLNRTLLLRQQLLERADVGVPAVVERLVGLQAQEPHDPYVALWSRIDRFRPSALASAIESRRAVRGVLMRSTIHLVTARDYARIRPVLQPRIERSLHGQQIGPRVKAIDLGDLLPAMEAELTAQPQSVAAMKRLIAERWPHLDAEAAVAAVRYLLPLAQVPPRGIWGKTAMPAWTPAPSWTGRPMARRADTAALVRRYLGAFGPATLADVRTWSGLAGLGEVVDRLRPDLRSYRDEAGRTLLDLDGAPLSDPSLPAPVRFLPVFDNLVLSHHDRSRVVSDTVKQRLPYGRAVFLVDGYVAGAWELGRGRDRKLVLMPVVGLTPDQREDLAAEAGRLAHFLEPDRELAVAVEPI